MGDNKVYAEHQAVTDNLVKAQSTVNEILRSGHADIAKLDKLARQARAHEAAKASIGQIAAPSFKIPPRPGVHEVQNKDAAKTKAPAKDALSKDAQNAHTEKHEHADTTVRKPVHTEHEKESDKNAEHSTRSDNKHVEHKSGIPKIDSESASKMNGMLRIDQDVYKINDGKLYKIDHSSADNHPVESKPPVGVIGPGYLFQLQGGKVESLADQNRVLMRFHIDGSKDKSEHMLLGLGASYVNKAGEHIAGGLISASDLSKASTTLALAVEQEKQASDFRRNWFDNAISGTISSGLDQDAASKVDRSKELAVASTQKINLLFAHGFEPGNLSASKFDAENKEIRHLMKESNLSAMSSAELIQKHEITNTLIREGLITGALTAATVLSTAVTDGVTAPAAAANMARGAELISMARSLGSVGKTAAFTGSLNTVLRFKEGKDLRATALQSLRDLADGSLQGIAMRIPTGQVKELGDLAKASTIVKTAAQAEIMQTGQRIRESGDFLPKNTQEAAGELAAATGLALFTHGLGTKLDRIPVLTNALNDANEKLAIYAVAKGGSPLTLEVKKLAAKTEGAVAAYLMEALPTGMAAATYSGMPAVPEAVQNERNRIARELGKADISAEEFIKHMKLANMTAYVFERAGIAGATAAAFSHFPGKSLRRSERGEPVSQSSSLRESQELSSIPFDQEAKIYAKAKRSRTGNNQESNDGNSEMEKTSGKVKLPESFPMKEVITKHLTEKELAEVKPLIEKFEQRAEKQGFDAKETYENLEWMLNEDNAAVPLEERREIFTQLLTLMTNLEKCNQGQGGNCVPASLERQLCTRAPAEVARLMAEMVNNGACITRQGTEVYFTKSELGRDFDAKQFSSKNDWEFRSHAQKILQGILANIHWQQQEYFTDQNGNQDYYGRMNIKYVAHKPSNASESGERLIGLNPFTGKFDLLAEHPQLSIYDLKRICEEVTGEANAPYIVIPKGNNKVFSTQDKTGNNIKADVPGLKAIMEYLIPAWMFRFRWRFIPGLTGSKRNLSLRISLPMLTL